MGFDLHRRETDAAGRATVSYRVQQRHNFGDGLAFPWRDSPLDWVDAAAAFDELANERGRAADPHAEYRVVRVTTEVVTSGNPVT